MNRFGRRVSFQCTEFQKQNEKRNKTYSLQLFGTGTTLRNILKN